MKSVMLKHLSLIIVLAMLAIGSLTAPVVAADAELLDYIEVLTADAEPGEALAMVAVIHGLGDRPESFIGFLQAFNMKLRVILPRGPIPWGSGHAWFGHSQNNNWDQLSPGVKRSARKVARLLDHLAASKPTQGRPVLTGFSQGGILSYAVASGFPQSIQLALPISGLLPTPLWPQKSETPLIYPPIHALHGSVDRVVPVTFARDTVAHLKAVGLDASLTEYPVAHTINNDMHRQLLRLIKDALARQK